MVRKLIEHVLSRLGGKKKAPPAPKSTSPIRVEHVKAPANASSDEFRPGTRTTPQHAPRREGGGHHRRPHPPRERPAHPKPTPAADAQPGQRAISPPWDPASFQVPPCEGKTRFQDLGLCNDLMHAIADLGFQYCTPIQAGVLPHTLKGIDAFGKAQTGTGKTAAFLLTIFEHFHRHPIEGQRKPGTPRALVLAPTRELCIQIQKDAASLGTYCPANVVAVFGGMDYEKQKRQLRGGTVDLVAATPGRLIDFRRRGDIDLRQVEILVIDEADRMLDMGFIPDVRDIVHSTPHKDRRQTLFFSATLTPEVKRLATQWTRDPISIEIEPEKVAVDTVEQVIYIVTLKEKFALLYNILQRENARRVIVFVNRRDIAEDLLYRLRRYNVESALLSGAVPQEKRLKVLEAFREGKVRVMVATDVAGRGIHVDDVTHVINYNMPMDPEDYVHRIGRTGRAGASGTSISFACEDDSFQIPALETFLGRPLACTHPEDEWLTLPPAPEGAPPEQAPRRSHGPSGGRPGGGRGGPRGRGRGGPRHGSGRGRSRGPGSYDRGPVAPVGQVSPTHRPDPPA